MNGNTDNAIFNFRFFCPAIVQYFHIKKMKDFLFDGKQHPSTGKTALHTGWVLDKILGIS